MELENLVIKAKQGSKDAFLELMLMHKEYLYRTAFLYTRDRDTARDVVQECIVKSMEAIDGLRKPEFFKTWLTRILINCARSALRQSKKTPVANDPDEWDPDERAGDPDAVSREEKLDLYRAIGRLDYPLKVIIIQKYFFDYRLQEIAGLLHMPLGTVKAYHSKAKKMLKMYLEDGNGLEPKKSDLEKTRGRGNEEQA